MIVWFSGVFLGGGTLAFASLQQMLRNSAENGDWLAVAIPCFMLAFGAALVGGGWWLSSGDKEFLIGAVRRIIESDPKRAKLEG